MSTSDVKSHEQPFKILEGVSGRIELYADYLAVEKVGLANLIIPEVHQKRIIPFSHISDVKLYSNRFLVNGLIKIFVNDEGGNVWFVFNGKHYPTAKYVVDHIEDINSRKRVHTELKDSVLKV